MGIFDILKVIFCVLNGIGIAANALQFVMLIRMKKIKIISNDAAVVFLNQAIIDFIISALAIFYTYADVSMMPEIYGDFEWIRPLICMVVYTQYPYWALNCVSIYNDVLLAMERCFAVVFPLKQQRFHSMITGIIILLYAINIVFRFPAIFYNEYDYDYHRCVARRFEGIFNILRYFGMSGFVVNFLFPLILFLLFNGITVKKLREKNNLLKFQNGNNVVNPGDERKNKAALVIVKVSIFLAVSYILCLSFTRIYYFINSITGVSLANYEIMTTISSGFSNIYFISKPVIVFGLLPGVKRFCKEFFSVTESSTRRTE